MGPLSHDRTAAAPDLRGYGESGFAGPVEDFRAGFSIDLELDEADHIRGLRVHAPLLTFWCAGHDDEPCGGSQLAHRGDRANRLVVPWRM